MHTINLSPKEQAGTGKIRKGKVGTPRVAQYKVLAVRASIRTCILIPKIHIKRLGHGDSVLLSQHWEGGSRWITGTH